MNANAKASLTLSDITATPPAPRRRTPANPQIETLKVIATHWNALTGDQKATWKALSGQSAQFGQNAMPNPAGAYATFYQVAAVMLGAGGSIPTTAPAQPVAPAPLPVLALAAAYGPGGLTLTLNPSAPYPYPVTLYAAPPLIAAPNAAGKAIFKRIGSLPGLTTSFINIAPQYLARFHVPSGGYQIALKVVGVSSSGHQTHGLLVTALAAAASQAARTGADEQTPMLKAA